MSTLREAAQALVDRWDTPLWKDAPHTGQYIDALRAALAQPERKPLPESEVKEMYRGMFCVPLGKRLTHHDWFQAGVLFAEEAHGIRGDV